MHGNSKGAAWPPFESGMVYPEFKGEFQQQVQIDLPVLVIEENRGAIVATLCDVMRLSGGYDAGNAVGECNGMGPWT